MSRLLVACFLGTIAFAASHASAQEHLLGPGLESEVARLTLPNGAPVELAGDVRVGNVQIESTHIEVALTGEGRAGRVDLFARGEAVDGWDAGQTRSFDVRLVQGDDPTLRAAALALRERIDARDGGGFFGEHATIAATPPPRRPIFDTELFALRALLWSLTLGGLALLAVWLRRSGVRIDRVDLGIAIGLFTSSLLLRCLLPPWAPLHANDHGIAELRGLTGDPRGYEAWLYGSAYLDALRLLLAPFGRNAEGPFVAAVAFGSLVPVVVFALARLLVRDARAGALLAALAVALHAGQIRLSASESPKPLAELLWIGGAALGVVAFRTDVAPRSRDLACILCALAWSLALELHVLTTLLPIAGASIVLAAAARRESAPRWSAVLAGVLVVAGTALLHLLELDVARTAASERHFQLAETFARLLGPENALFDPTITPSFVLPFALVSLAMLALRGHVRVVLGLVLAAAILMPPSLLIDACRTDAIRYQAEAQLPILLALAGFPTPALAGRRWLAPCLAAAALVLSSVAGLADVSQPDVHAQAYAVAITDAPAPPATILVAPRLMQREPRVLSDFPDFAIAAGTRVTTDPGTSGDCRLWIGPSCWSFAYDEDTASSVTLEPGTPMRPECVALLGGIDRAREALRTLEPLTVPHRDREFHHILATHPRVGYAPCP